MEGTTRKIDSFSNRPAVLKGSRDYKSSRRAGRERDQARRRVSPSFPFYACQVEEMNAASFFCWFTEG